MKIEIAEVTPRELRGRPNKYPFKDLLPGHRLVIPICNDDDKTSDDQRRIISSAIYQFKKNNKLKWETATRIDIENGNINVYRIS